MSLRISNGFGGCPVSDASVSARPFTSLTSAIRDGAIQLRKRLDYFKDLRHAGKFEKCLLNATSEERGIVLEVLGRYQKEEDQTARSTARPNPIFQFSSSPDDYEQDLVKIVTTLKVLSQCSDKPLTFFQKVLALTPTMISLSSWFSSFKQSIPNPRRLTTEEPLGDFLARMETSFPFLNKAHDLPAPRSEVSPSNVATGLLLPEIAADEALRNREVVGPNIFETSIDSIRDVFNRMIARLSDALSLFFQSFQSKAAEPVVVQFPVLELDELDYDNQGIPAASAECNFS